MLSHWSRSSPMPQVPFARVALLNKREWPAIIGGLAGSAALGMMVSVAAWQCSCWPDPGAVVHARPHALNLFALPTAVPMHPFVFPLRSLSPPIARSLTPPSCPSDAYLCARALVSYQCLLSPTSVSRAAFSPSLARFALTSKRHVCDLPHWSMRITGST